MRTDYYRWATAEETENHLNGGEPIDGAVWVRINDEKDAYAYDLAVPDHTHRDELIGDMHQVIELMSTDKSNNWSEEISVLERALEELR